MFVNETMSPDMSRTSSSYQHIAKASLVWLGLTFLVSGCSLLGKSETATSSTSTDFRKLLKLGDGPEAESPAKGMPAVANPPAKTIRFDGNEVVLGTADASQLDLPEFESRLAKLIAEGKFYSASRFADRNRNVGERLLWKYWADSNLSDTQAGMLRLLAQAQSKGLPNQSSWSGLMELQDSQPSDCAAYRSARIKFTQLLKSGDPDDTSHDAALQAAAQRLQHPLVTSDALQLMALRELLAGRNAWSEALYRQAVEISVAAGDLLRAGDCSLLVSAAASRSEDSKSASETWLTAIEQHAAAQLSRRTPVDVSFWQAAVLQKPVAVEWPVQIVEVLAAQADEVGCQVSYESSVELVLWTAVAHCQYKAGDAQLALVNFKKAESFASHEDKLWLRIAQSRCLAALDQGAAAAAILSGPAASSKPHIAAAARAAMGSAKLQSGAYQQGAQLLNKAIDETPGVIWPSKLDAEADLALALAILGETDAALVAMHRVQKQFQRDGNLVSLIQSLENELQLLELEGRTEAVTNLQKRIQQIERS